MKCTVEFTDDPGYKRELPDISYKRFIDSDLFKSGASDTEYARYLRENNMVELDEYNSQSTKDIVLTFEDEFSGRVMRFKLIDDSDTEYDPV